MTVPLHYLDQLCLSHGEHPFHSSCARPNASFTAVPPLILSISCSVLVDPFVVPNMLRTSPLHRILTGSEPFCPSFSKLLASI